jgi:hypothetical protein
VVDLGIVAVGVGAALDGEGVEPGRRVAERAGRALDDVLQLLLGIGGEEGGALERPQLHADAGLLEVVDHRLGEIGVGGIAVVVAGIEAVAHAGVGQQLLRLGEVVHRGGGFQ